MHRRMGAALAALTTIAALTTLPATTPAAAAGPLDGFDPGLIISDANFYNSQSQTAASLQAFFDAKGAACVPNPDDATPCLKDYRTDTPAMTANTYCAAIPAMTGASAATIVSRVSTACGFNPEALVVILEKEQSLVTASGSVLSPRRYKYATSASCPDFVACDDSIGSFFMQVYATAQRFQKWKQRPDLRHWPVGPVQMQYNPETSCGAASFTIRNGATASLYSYTPFVPNAAAIADPYGYGDYCSAYGNRNFYRYMRAWFPHSVTASTAPAIVPTPPSTLLTPVEKIWGEYYRLGADRTLGWEMSETTCDSWSTGPCRKAFEYGTITWSATAGVRAYLDKAVDSSWDRLSGANRYDLAAAVSARTFAAGTPVAYVASGEGYSDALPGGLAAFRGKGPLLLVNRDSVPAATLVELDRLKPSRIVVLGGLGTVSDAVAQQLDARYPEVVRWAGANRYAGAVAISREVYPDGHSTVLVASGSAFADALSAANLFPLYHGPILLSDAAGLDAGTLAEVERLGATRAYIVGGAGSVPDAAVSQLEAAGLAVQRFAGADRFAVNREVVDFALPAPVLDFVDPAPGQPLPEPPRAPQVFLASGEVFADGLAVGAPAALQRAPLLLTRRSCVPLATARYIKQLNPVAITLVGGSGTLDESLKRLPLC